MNSDSATLGRGSCQSGVTLTNPKAADLTAKCNLLATMVLAAGVGYSTDADVKTALDKLATVVRNSDPAVADALAANAKSAAAWCKAKGMTNA